MSGKLIWREDLAAAPTDGAVAYVLALKAANPLAPTSRDLSEAPANEPARAAFLGRRGLTRRIVALRLGVDADEVAIGHAASGAPVLVSLPAELHLSVAGRGDVCAIALAPNAIGVDIEPIGRVEEPAWNILHERERHALRSRGGASRHECFLRIWTAKEAYLKALGLGLALEPSGVVISGQADGAFSVSICAGGAMSPAPLAAAQWWKGSLRGENCIAACVVLEE